MVKAKAKRKPSRKPVIKKMMANSLKITKEHKVTGLDNVLPFGTTVNGLLANRHWYMVDLCHLARNYVVSGASAGASLVVDETQRESSRIFHKNSRVKFDIIPDPLCLNPIQYRLVLGYFKGDDNLGTSQFTSRDLDTGYSSVYSQLKRGQTGNKDFVFTYVSKTHTITPKMIYDANGSDDQTLGETMKAIWLPRHHELNFQANRVRTYESDEGDSLDGWRPFFAIQCIPTAGSTGFSAPDLITDTSGSRGDNPTPMLTMDVRTYFQDIN